VAHHAGFAVWFEIARTELLRAQGMTYRDVEASGVYLVVARLNVRFHKPARYDDQLHITVRAQPSGGIKLEHAYEVHRDDQLLATGQTTLVCVDEAGRARAVPESLQPPRADDSAPSAG
jgi:acyl-CoA thioester hydrolase